MKQKENPLQFGGALLPFFSWCQTFASLQSLLLGTNLGRSPFAAMTAGKHVKMDLGHMLLDWLVRVMFSPTLLCAYKFWRNLEMGMSQNSDARNFPLSVKYINISFEHPYFETFPDLCGCLSFRSCNLSLSMRLFRRRVGINGRGGPRSGKKQGPWN